MSPADTVGRGMLLEGPFGGLRCCSFEVPLQGSRQQGSRQQGIRQQGSMIVASSAVSKAAAQ